MKQLRRLSKVYPSLGVSRRVAYAWAREGKMPAMYINGTWLVDVEQFERWLASHRLEVAAPATSQTDKRLPPRWKPVPATPSTSPGAEAIATRRKTMRATDAICERTGLSPQFVQNNLRKGVPSAKLLAKMEELGVQVDF